MDPLGAFSQREVDLSGQELDQRYRTIRLIGEGGMGAVYEAEHLELRRRVAIKVLHAAYSRDAEAVTRFREEARAASRIGHANIVDVTDSGTTGQGRIFFVMELLSGVDLAAVIAAQPRLSLERALHITEQLCEALHAAHESGIVHRDLKPENIFLTEHNGNHDFVKILDFGIAKNLALAASDGRLTMPGVAMGTPEYMAPEQAAGEDVDRRVDVYATATILYEMLTGRLPYRADNLMQLLNKKASDLPDPPSNHRPGLAQHIEAAILQGLQADPHERLPSMRALTEALQTHPPVTLAYAEGGLQNAATTPQGIIVGAEGELAQTVVAARPTPTPVHTRKRSAKATKWWIIGSVLLGFLLPIFWWFQARNPSGNRSDRPQSSGKRISIEVGKLRSTPKAHVTTKAKRVVPTGAERTAQSPSTTSAAPTLTPPEVDRLLEWAKRAAFGGRYLRPREDNVRDLLNRIERDQPDNPAVANFRQRFLARHFSRRGRRAIRRKRYAWAAQLYRSWAALDNEAKTPQLGLARVSVLRGKRSLARRRLRSARRFALEAQRIDPANPRAVELQADVSMRRKRYKEAAELYQRALAMPQTKGRLRRWVRKKLAAAKRRI